jgi:hypothetical protein
MAQFKTLQFSNSPRGQADKVRALQLETSRGWRVVSETIIPGKFKGSQTCCLFMIFAPCAFLAGHKDDIISITLPAIVYHLEHAKNLIALKIAAKCFSLLWARKFPVIVKKFPVMAFRIPCYLPPSPTVEPC